MNEPKISIIVPAYNNEKYIEKCVVSISGQTLQDIEIIIVNDGSRDRTQNIIEKLKKEDIRIKLISQKNMGATAARKRGIAEAKGEWIGFVDADDWIEADMYEQLLSLAEKNNCELVSSGITHDYEDNRPSDELYDNYEEKKYLDIKKDIWPTMLFDESIGDMGLKCTLVNKLYRKEILEKAFLNITEKVTYGEDALTLYSYCLLIHSMYIKRKSYYHYYIHSESKCRTPNETLITNNYYLYTNLKAMFEKQSEKYLLLKQLRHYLISLEKYTLKGIYNIDLLPYIKWDFSGYKDVYDKKIIIYGGGACGQAFFNEISRRKKEQNIVAWVDVNYLTVRENCLYDIQPIEYINQCQFDVIIVAVKNKQNAQNIIKTLENKFHIDARKINWYPVQYDKII